MSISVAGLGHPFLLLLFVAMALDCRAAVFCLCF